MYQYYSVTVNSNEDLNGNNEVYEYIKIIFKIDDEIKFCKKNLYIIF